MQLHRSVKKKKTNPALKVLKYFTERLPRHKVLVKFKVNLDYFKAVMNNK